MCGISGVIQVERKQNNQYIKSFKHLEKRGPDQQYYQLINNVFIGFSRLAIMQIDESGMQPYLLLNRETKIAFMCNGEIYNFKELAKQYDLESTKTETDQSIEIKNRDCIVIPLLYMKLGFEQFCKLFEHDIKGEFAFSLFEFDQEYNIKQLILGRDLVGIRPLYVSKESYDNELIAFSSSMKVLEYFGGEIVHFEPGTIQRTLFKQQQNKTYIDTQEIIRFDWIYNDIPQIKLRSNMYLQDIRDSLIQAVKIRMNSDQPICFLLSGGLDSSLICSIAQQLSKTPIHTFCCGIAEKGEKLNTNDILNARKVAEFIGSIHTEVSFTRQEALDAIPEVIQNIGTWCQTTIRASTPMYLLCKYIKNNTQFKVVFTGELSDELFSGYLYNYELQKDEYIDKSSKLMVKNVHKYDVLRADGCISQNSLESRVPFSDQDVIHACWQIPSNLRHPKYKDCEKYWLRQAFLDTIDQPIKYLPFDVLFRTKVAFSNSIADNSEKTWIQSIKDQCLEKGTSELDYYLQIYKDYFGSNRLNILENHWQPHRFDVYGQLITEFIDSSAEVLDIYKKKFSQNTNQSIYNLITLNI